VLGETMARLGAWRYVRAGLAWLLPGWPDDLHPDGADGWRARLVLWATGWSLYEDCRSEVASNA
jgi:hypothetical protein